MLLFQKFPNSLRYTYDKITCDWCWKNLKYAYEIKDKWKFCNECMNKNMRTMSEDFFRMRKIEKEITTPEKRKIERSQMTLKKRYEVLKRDNFQCVLCWSRENLEIDHKTPVSEWGKSIKENLQTLCFKCNRGKGTIV